MREQIYRGPTVVDIPKVRVFASHLQQGMDPDHAEKQGITPEVVKLFRRGEAFSAGIGV